MKLDDCTAEMSMPKSKTDLTDWTRINIWKYKDSLKFIEEFHAKVEKIIKDVYREKTYGMDGIIYIDFNDDNGFRDNMLHICFSYGDDYGRETVEIPRYWLNEGFDYMADYKRIQARKAEENKKKKERIVKTKEEKERAEYERLKKKFEKVEE